jgi:serine/threonine protein kinase HipA of HipAB toxin-antitoxin module
MRKLQVEDSRSTRCACKALKKNHLNENINKIKNPKKNMKEEIFAFEEYCDEKEEKGKRERKSRPKQKEII